MDYGVLFGILLFCCLLLRFKIVHDSSSSSSSILYMRHWLCCRIILAGQLFSLASVNKFAFFCFSPTVFMRKSIVGMRLIAIRGSWMEYTRVVECKARAKRLLWIGQRSVMDMILLWLAARGSVRLIQMTVAELWRDIDRSKRIKENQTCHEGVVATMLNRYIPHLNCFNWQIWPSSSIIDQLPINWKQIIQFQQAEEKKMMRETNRRRAIQNETMDSN